MPQLFTRTFIVSALLLLCHAAFAQRPLSNSRQSSYYTYIYKLSAADVLGFYKSPLKPFDDKVLRNPVDSFRTDKAWVNNLPEGNYIKVFAQENSLKYSLIENHSAQPQMFVGSYEHRFTLTDKKGNFITDAKVLLNGKAVAYDAQSNTWYFKKGKKGATNILEINFHGVANFFSIAEKPSYNYYGTNNNNWVQRAWASVKGIFKKTYSDRYTSRQSPYSGFMAFNKPMYKPGDTVKFKAFIVNRGNKQPISNKKLIVKVAKTYQEAITIGAVNCYRPGGFEYSFVLKDSLDIQLDEDHRVMLTDPAKDKKPNDNNEKNEAYYQLESNALVTGNFRYEEYELKNIKFEVRIDKKEHWRGTPLAVYLKASDANGLPVPDGRISLLLTSNNSDHYNAGSVYVPDTLWKYNGPLDAIGETKVLIPDSIFPKASVKYNIDASFLNSDNESRKETRWATFWYQDKNIDADMVGDTLKASYREGGKDGKATAFAYALNAKRDTLSRERIMLPGYTLVNPNADSYIIETDSAKTTIELKQFGGSITLSSTRTADSVFMEVDNPRNLHFFYSVFAASRLIDGGQGTKLLYKRAYTEDKVLTFSVNYVWGGVPKTEEGAITYRKDQLKINVKQPVSVYPGQKVQTDILVTDVTGQPVPNTDITAWAITGKFSYNAPYPPYLGTFYQPMKRKYPFDVKSNSINGSLKLNWQLWGRQLGLDSIAYYQFTHPKSAYRIEEPGIDTVTQIAPFIVQDGEIVPVHILYIDQLPVYFSQAQQLQRHSFNVSPGKHSLIFRTIKQYITVDSVMVTRSKKLILSINADAYAAKPMPDTISPYEAGLLNQYMVTVDNNFGGKKTLITHNNGVFLLNPNGQAGSYVLTGPLGGNYGIFEHQGDKPRLFSAEPNYVYLFEPGFMRMKNISSGYPFSMALNYGKRSINYRDQVLTRAAADSIWQDHLDQRNHLTTLFDNYRVADKNAGVLQIERENNRDEKGIMIKNVIIYRYDDPDFIMVYPGIKTNFGKLQAGKYRMLFLLKGDTYDIKENIIVKPYGTNFYRMTVRPIHPRDSVSIKISRVINDRYTSISRNEDERIENDALKLKEAFNGRYLATTGLYTELITGTVMAKDDGLPVPGATVKIKGTTIGTQTTNAGKFSIMARTGVKLIVSFLGYNTQELNAVPGGNFKIVLENNPRQLGEVVVTGYLGIKRAKNLSYSISNVTNFTNGLSGKAPGLLITQGDATLDSNMRFTLRGNKALTGDGTALIILDGVPLKSLTRIDPSLILETTILNGAAATALYGSEAANGVIIITTKKSGDALRANPDAPIGEGRQTLRKNFSDYAYWQPKLTTDASGKASFSSVFPDDITNWRTFVVAINGQRQSGFSEKQIKSFKPLSANFIAPQFAVEGDEMSLIGKVMNYNSTPAKLSRTFSYNGKILAQGDFNVSNSKIDTLPIVASATDSLSFEYSIKRDNGYFDGEQRKIPVMKQGVQETKGVFEALDRDTTMNLKFDPAMGPVTFRAEASALPALAEEAKRLREYKYLCNEQLASKLKGLLSEKRIKTFLGEAFIYERNILDIIKKLQQSRKPNGTWGWWADTNEELWISLHAVEALTEAQKMGYTIQLDKQKLTDYLVYQMESYRGDDKLTCLQLLHRLDAKVDYAKYFGVIEKEYKALKEVSTYNRLKLLLLKQQTGISIKTDSLLSKAHKTLFGNMYWGEENYRFFDNSIQQSIIAYQIIKAEGKHPEVLAKIRGYFLEQRKLGEWRNTYESALILETILPDLLQKGTQLKPAVLTLKSSTTETVTVFPYTTTLKENTISLSKTGSLPVYITGYQQFWNSKPQKVNKEFTVNTRFERKGDNVTRLKGGEAVQLKAEVIVKGDADFVMLEIPIPAGCSYESREQQWSNNEVHREFFKEKVSIFCRKLKEGTYTFTVNLMPRYSGNYTLNPAKAEQMYFPVFYGMERMKKVVVQ